MMRKPSAAEGEALTINMSKLFTRAQAKECKNANTFACRAWTAAKRYCTDKGIDGDTLRAATSKYVREGRSFWNTHVGAWTILDPDYAAHAALGKMFATHAQRVHDHCHRPWSLPPNL